MGVLDPTQDAGETLAFRKCVERRLRFRHRVRQPHQTGRGALSSPRNAQLVETLGNAEAPKQGVH